MNELLTYLEMYNGAVTAVATVVMALFTAVLVCVTRGQLAVANSAIKLARDEFISTHRPSLRVRRMVFSGFLDFGPDVISNGDEVKITVDIVNVGGVSARLVNSRYAVIFHKGGIPSDPNKSMHQKLADESVLFAVGERRSFEMKGTAHLTDPGSGMRVMNQFKFEGWSMFVFGEVTYRDASGSERSTGFARKWGGNGFERIDNYDYEYED